MKLQPYPLLLSALLLLPGCTTQSPAQTSQAPDAVSSTTTATGVDLSQLFSDRDFEIGYDEDTAVHIQLGAPTTTDSDAVTVDGGTVTITQEGTYILTGTLEEGMVIVQAPDTDKIQLVLDGAHITSPTSAAIYVASADKVFLTTAADSANTLENGGSYVAIDDNNIDGVIFSKSDLTLNGAGSLTITSQGGHGVVSKDDLVVTCGTYDVDVSGQGLSGKDSVAIANGTFTLQTGKDGIQSDNEENAEKGFVYLKDGTYTITADGDGVSASSWMEVDGGTYTITTGGGSANGETHTDTMDPGGMGGGMDNGMGGGPGTGTDGQPPERPDGMQPPDDGGGNPGGSMEPPDQSGTELSATVFSSADTTQDTTQDTTTSTKGLKAGTALTITGGTFQLDCADDAFHTNGDLTVSGGCAQISTGDDALHADLDLVLETGELNITTCYEGLEGQTVSIHGGTVDLVASDDGINAAGDPQENILIDITGGTLTIDAGGDGLDSNGDLTMSGGTVLVSGPAQGADTALDYDGTASITGGTFIGVGQSGMAQNFGDASTQGSILLTVDSQSAESAVSLAASDGTVLASWDAVPKGFTSVLISCPGLTVGSTYSVTAGTSQTEVTLDSLIYGSSSMQQPGQMGQMGRPRS